MLYKKQVQSTVNGAWLDSDSIADGAQAKITGETTSHPSNFLDKKGNPKTQDVAKIMVKHSSEEVNVNVNRPSLNALIDAFGEDSTLWIGKIVTLTKEKVRVAGVTRTAVYLVPEGYVKTDDENGYATVIPRDYLESMVNPPAKSEEPMNEEVAPEDIPW